MVARGRLSDTVPAERRRCYWNLLLLTGRDAQGPDLATHGQEPPLFLETSQPGLFAVGNVRSGLDQASRLSGWGGLDGRQARAPALAALS
jgi:hypothetical protein